MSHQGTLNYLSKLSRRLSSLARPIPSAPALRELHPVSKHAAALLVYVREAGYTGAIAAADFELLYQKMCVIRRWTPHKWNTLAACVRRLTTQRKTYACINGKRTRVYIISEQAILLRSEAALRADCPENSADSLAVA